MTVSILFLCRNSRPRQDFFDMEVSSGSYKSGSTMEASSGRYKSGSTMEASSGRSKSGSTMEASSDEKNLGVVLAPYMF